jgi:acetyl-CoA synthetase
MTWHVELDDDSYEAAHEGFAWDLPDDYNLAHDFLRKHDDGKATALYQRYPDGREETYSFEALDRLSDRVAAGLADRGVERGDRVAVVVPQKPANPLTHLACWKLGAVSLPLSVLFGADALEYRFRDAGARVAVVDTQVSDAVSHAREGCPDLEHVIEVDGSEPSGARRASSDSSDGEHDDTEPFEALHEGYEAGREIADTTPATNAVILYTSGSTGPPKGVLHGHGVWVGHCPAFYMYFERKMDGVYWTPADWAWIGALGDLVFPAWHYGQPVVGYPMGSFDPEDAYEILERYDVTDAFIPPTAIRMMMAVDDPTGRYDLSLGAICSGGEPLTAEILAWASRSLEGVVVNELYGQTEANLLVANCRDWFEARPGSMGKPVPGHDVAIIDDETGEEMPTGEVGHIAVRRRDDPVVFTEYWNAPEKTEAASVEVPASEASGESGERSSPGRWHLTGDLGSRDEDGYLWFKARDDDVIITAGYRVGPGEVESAILEHDDVEQVGVVGVPDEMRGEVIKAFVKPVPGVEGDDPLREEITAMVREDLAKHEYPREIEFMDDLPTTTTGKIRRKELREGETPESD